MNRLMIAGALFVLLGALGFAIPAFTTQHTTDVASFGDLKFQTQEVTTHLVPSLASASALALGLALIGGGLFRRR